MSTILERVSEVNTKPEHWDTFAQSYYQLGAPLHPTAEDIAAMTHLIAQVNAAAGGRGVKALMWGATPAIADLDWPTGSYLLAVDRSTGIINRVWPGDIPRQRKAKCADWLTLRLEAGAYDVVIGDGSFNCLEYPLGYQRLGSITQNALQPQGALIARFFVKPAKLETLDTVFQALMRGRIGSFHAFKWRLAMAILGDSQVNIAVRDIWHVWQQAEIDQAKLMAVTGWSAATIATINNYQQSDAYYSFPSFYEIQQLLADRFVVSHVYTPTYELGDRCPTVMFRPQNYV